MTIRIRPAAIDDLDAGATFYERQAVGLAHRFLDALAEDIESLEAYAGIHIISHNHYRLISKRFPYAIYYKIEGEVISIERVLDLRRNPSRIRTSLKNDPD